MSQPTDTGGKPAEQTTTAAAEGTPPEAPATTVPSTEQEGEPAAVSAAAEKEALTLRISELEGATQERIEAEATRQLQEMFPDWSGDDPHAAPVPVQQDTRPAPQPTEQQSFEGAPVGTQPDETTQRLQRLEHADWNRQVNDEAGRIRTKVEGLVERYPEMDPREVLLAYSQVPDGTRVDEDKFLEFHAKRTHSERSQELEAYHQRRLTEERAAPTPPPVPTGAAGTPGSAAPPKTYGEAKKLMVEKLKAAFGQGG